jgi:hypothetical protein
MKEEKLFEELYGHIIALVVLAHTRPFRRRRGVLSGQDIARGSLVKQGLHWEKVKLEQIALNQCGNNARLAQRVLDELWPEKVVLPSLPKPSVKGE